MHSGSLSDALTAMQFRARSRKAADLLLVDQEPRQHRLQCCNMVRILQAMENECELRCAFEIISTKRRRIAASGAAAPAVWVCMGQKSSSKFVWVQMLPPKSDAHQNLRRVCARDSRRIQDHIVYALGVGALLCRYEFGCRPVSLCGGPPNSWGCLAGAAARLAAHRAVNDQRNGAFYELSIVGKILRAAFRWR